MDWQSLRSSQRRKLLELMFSGETPLQSTYDAKLRAGLVKAGLITLEKRPKGRGKLMVLTDRTWSGALDLMTAELEATERRDKGTKKDLAFHLTARVHGFLKAREVAAVDFVRPQPAAAESSGDGGLDRAVRDAYLGLTRGAFNRRVRLADLRAALPAVERGAVDDALVALMRAGVAHLMPLDDPRERGPDDDSHAVHVAGSARHIVYLEDR